MSRTCSRLVCLFSVLALVAACGGGGAPKKAPQNDVVRIGLLLDLVHERWEHDRTLFVAKAKEMGAEALVRAAEGDHARQVTQARELLDQGIKVLVIVPHDMERAAEIVALAKDKKVPVVSYDRLVRNADVDLYVSFDNTKVGKLQANYLLAQAPRGNYVLIGGAPEDNNAKLIREGQMDVLQTAVKSGQVRIVADPWAANWDVDAARTLTEDAITKAKGKITAVVASNDRTAGGAIDALNAHGLAGKVLVSGQDAELDAVRRIVAGTQAMTVYKPIRSLVYLAVRNALRLAEGARVDTAQTVNNGKKDVPAMLLEPIAVDKGNIDFTVISDGYQKREEVYQSAAKH
jgi:D-xylose transport system substrate-binding protein